MQFAFVRELRVRRRRGFGIDLLAMTLTAGLAVTALAQDISPATKRLFDAVWADDLGRVKAAITAGASISAVNELGVRPVDMAVDRGHFGIAHYLLSVEKQRRDAATQEPVSKPAERALASTVTPAPTSSLPGSGWLVGSTATRQTAPTVAPAAVPAPAASPVPPVTPTAIARSAPSALPTAQEQLWSPDASGEKSSLQVVSVAKPQPIVAPASSAGSINDAPVPQVKPRSESGSGGQSPDWLNRVTDLFQFSEKETAPTTPASPSNIAAVGSEELAPKAAATDQPSQAASAPFQDAVSNPAVREEQADRVKAEMSEMPENKISPPLSSGAVGAPAASTQVAALLQGGGTTTGGNSARVSSPRGSAAPLVDVRLTLSEDQGLGRRMPAPGVGQCVNKIRWNTVYCIEPLAWLSDLASAFNISSNFYRGPKSIVEYVAGRSVQIHVLFNTEEIQRVTKHFTDRYGRPTEQPEIWTDLIGRKKRPNRTLRWRNRDSKTGEVTVLEIREIDDLRWSSPPDTRHGALRIYTEKRGSVFKLLSWTDLLLVQLRRRR